MEKRNKKLKSTESPQEWAEKISFEEAEALILAGTLDWMRKSKKRSAMIPKSYA